MPLHRRIPKRGFHNLFSVEYSVVNLEELNVFPAGETVTPELLRAHGQGLRGVFHCFSGNVAQAEECLSFEGFMLSFAGPLTKQGNALPEVACMAPLDRILVETDSPYLVPKPLQARRNEPLFVKYVAEKLAEFRGMTLEEIAQITTANAVRLFGLGEVV